MKPILFVAGACLLAGQGTVYGQTKIACDSQALDAPLRSKALLTVDSRSAGLEIVGVDQDILRVSCVSSDTEKGQKIRMQFSGNQDDGKLTIQGGSSQNDNFRVRIEVPRKTSLRIQMPAGQVKIEEIAGDKDIHLYAGQVTISSTRAWKYRDVDLSVDIGEVKASMYGAEKGGFFRTFTSQTVDGEYGLRAHVITGEIELLGRGAAAE